MGQAPLSSSDRESAHLSEWEAGPGCLEMIQTLRLSKPSGHWPTTITLAAVLPHFRMLPTVLTKMLPPLR